MTISDLHSSYNRILILATHWLILHKARVTKQLTAQALRWRARASDHIGDHDADRGAQLESVSAKSRRDEKPAALRRLVNNGMPIGRDAVNSRPAAFAQRLLHVGIAIPNVLRRVFDKLVIGRLVVMVGIYAMFGFPCVNRADQCENRPFRAIVDVVDEIAISFE